MSAGEKIKPTIYVKHIDDPEAVVYRSRYSDHAHPEHCLRRCAASVERLGERVRGNVLMMGGRAVVVVRRLTRTSRPSDDLETFDAASTR